MLEIIAEIANAHQGDVSTALKLASAARDAGADSVKFQVYHVDELLTENHPGYGHFKAQSFSENEWGYLLKGAGQLGIKVYADIFGLEAFRIAADNNVEGYKVHSSDLSNTKLLAKLSYQNKKIFLGIGGCTVLEIKYALGYLTKFSKPSEIVLLHGFQAYPTRVEDSSLSKIGKLKQLFPDIVKIGYSDHTDADSRFSTLLPVMAITYGISYIEKHITFNRANKGTDYFSSFEPYEFKQFVCDVRLSEKAIGSDPLKFSDAERQYRQNCKKAWVAAKPLKGGIAISEEDIIMKRVPGFTSTPDYEEINNNVLLHDKEKDAPITMLDLRHKVLAVIVARLGSSRLANKAVLDINGKPAISHLFERIKIAKNKGYVDTVAFCTTEEGHDDKLVEIARGYSFKIYRGATENVLSRMMLAIGDNADHDIILRITGDDLLVDAEYLKKTVEYHLKTCSDYTDAKSLPSGTEVEVFDARALKLIYELSNDISTSEYLTNYIRNNKDQFNTASLPVDKAHSKKYRLTLDTAEDYEVIKKLLAHMKDIGREYDYSMDDVCCFFEKNPALSKVNSSCASNAQPVLVNTEINWQAVTKGPLVTVYITNHNYGAYIKEAVDSVLNQKFRDFELLIIDDGSTDNSRLAIESYRANPLVKIVYQNNKGLNISNNIALNLSRGRYIMRLDADDYLDENALLVMVTKLERDGGLGLVFPDYYLVDEKGNVFGHERRQDCGQVTLKDRPAHGAGTMIRKNILMELGGYCEDFKCQDGYELWLKFVKKSKVANINLPLFYYRQHGNNLTRDQEKILATRHEIIKKSVNGGQIKAKNHIAVIPIRGGEKDIPFAMRSFAGTTLLDIAITGVLAAENISKAILTTPDERIINCVKEAYADKILIDKRPQRLSALNIKTEDVIDYLIDQYKQHFKGADTINIINLEYPLRSPMYIDKAINTLYLFEVDSVISVRQRNNNFFRHEGAGLVPFESNRALNLERDIIFEEIGGIHTVRYDSYLKFRSLMSGKAGHIIIDELSSIRLSNGIDFEISEYLYRKRYEKKR